MIKAKKLTVGDQVAIVAPSGGSNQQTIRRSDKTIRALGLQPIFFKSCYSWDTVNRQSLVQRILDINEAFYDPSIKAIFSLKAGNGAWDVLERLDYRMIQNHPKIFIGFSDITAIHLTLNQKCGLVSFHGPLASSKIRNKKDINSYTKKSLDANLFQARPIGRLSNPPGHSLWCLKEGTAKGQLIGGNLTLIVRSLNTKYEINTTDKILFLEDMGESFAKLSEMLTLLKTHHKLQDCSGIILGTFIKCGGEVTDPKKRETLLKQLLLKTFNCFDKPIIANLYAGHNLPMLTLPLGVRVSMDGASKRITVLENAVVD